MVAESNPVIFNCTIHDADDDGIELHDSRARIENTTIHNCSHGIYMEYSSPYIANCTIYDTVLKAIKRGSESDPVYHNNTITNPARKGLKAYIDPLPLNVLLLAVVVIMVKPWDAVSMMRYRRKKGDDELDDEAGSEDS